MRLQILLGTDLGGQGKAPGTLKVSGLKLGQRALIGTGGP